LNRYNLFYKWTGESTSKNFLIVNIKPIQLLFNYYRLVGKLDVLYRIYLTVKG